MAIASTTYVTVCDPTPWPTEPEPGVTLSSSTIQARETPLVSLPARQEASLDETWPPLRPTLAAGYFLWHPDYSPSRLPQSIGWR